MSFQAFCSVKAKKMVCPWLCVGEQQQGELGTGQAVSPPGRALSCVPSKMTVTSFSSASPSPGMSLAMRLLIDVGWHIKPAGQGEDKHGQPGPSR